MLAHTQPIWRSIVPFTLVAIMTSVSGLSSAQDSFCEPLRLLDDAARNEFASAIGSKSEDSAGDYIEYQLRREYIPAGVRSRSDCTVGVLKSNGALEGEVECVMKFPAYDHNATRSESRRVAEEVLKCLAPTSQSLGSAIHRFTTQSARWELAVPNTTNHINLRIIPRRP